MRALEVNACKWARQCVTGRVRTGTGLAPRQTGRLEAHPAASSFAYCSKSFLNISAESNILASCALRRPLTGTDNIRLWLYCRHANVFRCSFRMHSNMSQTFLRRNKPRFGVLVYCRPASNSFHVKLRLLATIAGVLDGISTERIIVLTLWTGNDVVGCKCCVLAAITNSDEIYMHRSPELLCCIGHVIGGSGFHGHTLRISKFLLFP